VTPLRRPWLLAAALLLGVLLAGNWPLLLGRLSPLPEAAHSLGPLFALASGHARAGQLPLWDPWTAAGTPLDGDQRAC
jgi:hypothetical protein